MKITDIVKDNKTARFDRYTDGNLWYVTEGGFDFPIPVEDTRGGVFQAEEKALHLMRWIRQHLARQQEQQQSQA
jgi:hypothetical protein